MFARRRFEFPHIVLIDNADKPVGVVQLEAEIVARQWIWRTGSCNRPHWPQWWVPFRVMRQWALIPVADDLERLVNHEGKAALKITPPRGASIDQVGVAMPCHTRISSFEVEGAAIVRIHGAEGQDQ